VRAIRPGDRTRGAWLFSRDVMSSGWGSSSIAVARSQWPTRVTPDRRALEPLSRQRELRGSAGPEAGRDRSSPRQALRAARRRARLRPLLHGLARFDRRCTDLRRSRYSPTTDVSIRRAVPPAPGVGAGPAVDLLSFWITFRGSWGNEGEQVLDLVW